MAMPAKGQWRTTQATRYNEFRPSLITFSDGHQSRQQLTNIFLKNSSLVYLSGEYTMEANMDNIVAVDFDDRSYQKIGRQLAWRVDTIGRNGLYCVELFDMESYERNLKNNVNFSNIDVGDQISTTTVDLNNEDDYKLPVFRHYYFQLGGVYIKVHERELNRHLSRDQRTMMKRIVGTPDFSWQSERSLMQLLKAISTD